MDLANLQASLREHQQSMPNPENWHPQFCGDIDMCIKHDGSWWYMGTPIGRRALVKLFARVLVRQENNYFLVTPAEKVGIQVEDVPFVVTEWQQQQGALVMTTNVGDQVIVSQSHPVVLQTDKHSSQQLPYVLVRRNLYARLHQNVFYQLVNIAREVTIDNHAQLVVSSGDYQFSLGNLAD